MPSGHLRPASKTADPEFPVVATSLITVGNLLRTFRGSNCGEIVPRTVALTIFMVDREDM
jgi:hypothetical protein